MGERRGNREGRTIDITIPYTSERQLNIYRKHFFPIVKFSLLLSSKHLNLFFLFYEMYRGSNLDPSSPHNLYIVLFIYPSFYMSRSARRLGIFLFFLFFWTVNDKSFHTQTRGFRRHAHTQKKKLSQSMLGSKEDTRALKENKCNHLR